MIHDEQHSSAGGNSAVEYPALEGLRESLAILCQDNPVAMCITNRQAQIFHANQAFLDSLESKSELPSIEGQTFHSLFPHHSHRVTKYIETLIHDEKSETLQKILHLGAKHTPTAMQIRVQMLHAPNSQHAEGALITLQQDANWYEEHFAEEKQLLTARIRQLSTDLMDRQSLLKAMMDRSPFGIALLDNQRRVIQLNRTAEKILGIARNEARGILCNNLFQCFELGQRCPVLEDRAHIDQQETACAQPGKQQHTFLRSAVLSHERNEDIIIEAFIDVSETKKAQQEKEAAYRAKDDFFAKMSHELRTPLNAIIGYSELLGDEDFPPKPGELKDFSGAIQRGGYDLLHLVDQVLTISKLNDSKVGSNPLDLRPEALIKEVTSTIQPLANRNHNQFSVFCDNNVGSVYADPEHLRAILLNLLSNACKFTMHGDVTLNIQRKIEATNEWVLFQIKDTGIGLTEEQVNRVFERFEQADNSSTRDFGGSGLGLSIAKDLCELMGGKIDVQSQPDRGSTFTVSLPGQQPTS